MENYRYFFLVIMLLKTLLCFGQSEIDTLQNKTYTELFEIINNKRTLNNKNIYANYLINKAKRENTTKFLIAGYHAQAIIHNTEIRVQYCDSIIILTESNSDEVYPLVVFQLKGDYFYEKKKYKKALDSYLKVSLFANKYNNKYEIFNSNYNIGIIKRKINEKEPALKLFKENYSYAIKNLDKIDTDNYLISITALANIYNDLNLPDSASYFNKLGVKESFRLKRIDYRNHFSLNEGVSMYVKKEYLRAIDSLEKYIPYFENKEEKKNLSMAYYYCGKAHLKIGKKEKAIYYFKKLDTVFQNKQSIYPVTREGYEHLISYYKNKKDINNQLVYINKLIKVDSILHSEEIYLNRKIFKEYDIPKLKSEKKIILKKKKEREVKFIKIIILISVILLITAGFLIYQNKKRKLYKIRFQEILNSNSNSNPSFSSNINKKIHIPNEIIDNVLKALDSFEMKQLFIKNITLNSLAKELDTNTNYLSKIINQYKDMSFSNYLNTLRIEYIINKLKTDVTIRKFTIKAIAEEAGFNNSESFSKAFEKVNGIKPSYFLRELDKFNTNN